MPIALTCPGCGKHYRLDDRLAGKQARCKCGAVLHVPAVAEPGPAAAAQDDDWVGEAFSAKAEPEAAPPPAAIAPSESEPKPAVEDQAAPPPPVPSAAKPPRPPWKLTRKRQRRAVGVAAIAYGALAGVALVVLSVLEPPDGFFAAAEYLAKFVVAAFIAVGGVLILKRHPQGPACAGLSCLFLCFFPAWRLVLSLLGALTDGQWLALLLAIVLAAVLYAVPVAIIAWSLREEMARQKREEEELFRP